MVECGVLGAKLSGYACAINMRLAIRGAGIVFMGKRLGVVESLELDRLLRCGTCQRCQLAMEAEIGHTADEAIKLVIEDLKSQWDWAYEISTLPDYEDYEWQRQNAREAYKRWMSNEEARERRREYLRKRDRKMRLEARQPRSEAEAPVDTVATVEMSTT